MKRRKEKQFMEMVRRQRDLIWRVCLGFSFSRAWTADDAMQEVLAALWTAMPGFRNECSERTWVYLVAVTTLRRIWRRQSNRPAASAPPLPEPSAEDSAEWSLRMFIDGFGEPDSMILNADLDGLSNAEIAELTGLSPSAVASRIYRRKQQLKEEYGK